MTDDMKARSNEQTFDSDYAHVDITNDLMFSTVMQDEALCIELLEYLLPLQPGRKIDRLEYRQFDSDASEGNHQSVSDNTAQTQKTILGYFGQRGVRLDVFVDDGETVYDLEMQTTSNAALPQRSRLIQSHMDISQLQRGAQYDELRPSFVIFICKFDPFGDDLYRYTFRNMCDERKDKPLDDGTCKLFFNTAGHIGDIPPRLKELLTYMNDTQAYPVEESKNDLIRKLDAAVNETKMKPVWRDAFMMYQMRLRDEAIKSREEGREEGKKETAIETAKRMLLKAMPTDLIAELSGLPLAEVNALKSQMVH